MVGLPKLGKLSSEVSSSLEVAKIKDHGAAAAMTGCDW